MDPNVSTRFHICSTAACFSSVLLPWQLDALVAVAHAIPALYRAEHPEDDSRQLGADDFLPIFIYVLVNSGVEGVASLSLILDNLCDPKKMIGEAGEFMHWTCERVWYSWGVGHEGKTKNVVGAWEVRDRERRL